MRELTAQQQRMLERFVTSNGKVAVTRVGCWVGTGIKPHRQVLDSLVKRKLVKLNRNGYVVTPEGRKTAKVQKAKARPDGEAKRKVGRPKGGPGYGGRPPDRAIRRTIDARALIAQLEKELRRPVDPLEGLLRFAANEDMTENFRRDCMTQALPYIYPHGWDLSKLGPKELDVLSELEKKAKVEEVVN
jgi:predicted transcriptional regulator